MLKYSEIEKIDKTTQLLNRSRLQATCIKIRSNVELVTLNEKKGQKFENNGLVDGGAEICKFTKP